MRDDTRDERRGDEALKAVPRATAPARRGTGQQVPHHPFGRTTLHARLALLKPRALKVGPAGGQH